MHCRLIISNLDACAATAPPPSSVGIALTPVAQRINSLEENSLLGGSGGGGLGACPDAQTAPLPLHAYSHLPRQDLLH